MTLKVECESLLVWHRWTPGNVVMKVLRIVIRWLQIANVILWLVVGLRWMADDTPDEALLAFLISLLFVYILFLSDASGRKNR